VASQLRALWDAEGLASSTVEGGTDVLSQSSALTRFISLISFLLAFVFVIRILLMQTPLFLPSQTSLQGVPELLRDVTVLGNYQHQHIVPLLCYSLSRLGGQQQACLVYPFMPGGSLASVLALRTARLLGAAARLRIAADVAAGLAYLHAPGAGLVALLHRNVKSSKVLLDERRRACVADVGLPMRFGGGALGYIDPEYLMTGERLYDRLSKCSVDR
jgi:serine/threonine protein kinase